MTAAATIAKPVAQPRRNAYDIFILVLTVMSLVVMGMLLLPFNEATQSTLIFFDNTICAIFLVDFVINLAQSSPKNHWSLFA